MLKLVLPTPAYREQVLENEVYEPDGSPVQRYWIEL